MRASRSSALLLLPISLFLSFRAAATLMEADLDTPGDALVTRDTDTGLDWLDLTETEGLIYAEVLAGAGGWIDDGWRHATTSEVHELLAVYGVDPGSSGYFDGDAGQPYLDLLGITFVTQQTFSGITVYLDALWGMFDDGNPDPNVGMVELSVDRYSTGFVETFVGVYEDYQRRDQTSSYYGHFLVRAVPEPSTVLLLASGLVALAARRRH